DRGRPVPSAGPRLRPDRRLDAGQAHPLLAAEPAGLEADAAQALPPGLGLQAGERPGQRPAPGHPPGRRRAAARPGAAAVVRPAAEGRPRGRAGRGPGVTDHIDREKVMTMQRSRRLASMAVVACLAVAGLSACRSESSVAAYIGDTRTTEKRVQAVWDDARAALGGDAAVMPISRTDVVNVLVGADLMKRVAARHNAEVPPNLPFDEFATRLRLPAKAEYVQLYTQYYALVYAVEQT